MIQNGLGSTFELIASSFIGNKSEMNVAVPEQLPQTPGEVIQQHWGDIVISDEQYAPEAIARMVYEEEGRKAQMTGITTRTDVLGMGAGIQYDKHLIMDGDPHRFEQVLRGEKPSTSLLNGEFSSKEIISKNDELHHDELHRQVVATREADKIDALRQRAQAAATNSMHAENPQFILAA